MAGKGEVGKLSVKVIPDLSKFGDELKRKLKQIQKKIGDLEVTFEAKVDLDEESLERAKQKVENEDLRVKARVRVEDAQDEVERLKRRLENITAEVKSSVNLDEAAKKKLEERLKNLKSEVRLATSDTDLAKLRKSVDSAVGDIKADIKVSKESEAELRSRLESLGKNLNADVKMDRASRKRLEEQLKALRAQIDVHAHLSEEQKKKLKHELNKLDGKATVNADLDDGKARFDLKRLTRSRRVTIHAELGKASFARVAAQLKALAGGNIFKNIYDQFNDLFRNLDTVALKFATVSSAVGSIVSIIGSGVGVISSLGIGIAKTTPALLALPGIMGTAAAGAGILIAALKDAKTVLADLKPGFEALQDQISASYWERAAQPIRDFANNALGALSPVISEVAPQFGGMTAAIADAANDHLPGFQSSLGYLAEALDLSGDGAGAFTDGLLTMGEVGAKYLPSIATWATNVAYSFQNWAQGAAASGQMDQAIQAAAKTFGTLKNIVVDLSGILAALFTAMASGSAPIDSIADALHRANAAVSGPLWQGTLSSIFSSMGEAAAHAFAGIGSLGDAFVSLAPTLAQILPMIGQIVEVGLKGLSAALQDPAFQGGLTSFFESVLVAVQALAPAMPALGQAFGAIATTAGQLLEAVAPLVAQLVESLAPILTQLSVLLTPIIQQLADFLMPVIQLLAPVVAELIAQLTPLISEILEAILPALLPIIQALSQALIPAIQLVSVVIQALMPVVQTVFSALSEIITAGVHIIEGIIRTVMALIQGDWSGAWEGIKQIGSGVWEYIKASFSGFGSVLVAIGKAAWALLGNVISAGWNWISTQVSNGISNVKQFFSDGWNYLTNLTQSIWQGLVSTISSWITNAINTVKNLPNQIKNVFSGAGNWLLSAGKNIINGLIGGITSMFSAVKNKLSSLTKYLPSWKGPAPVDKVILRGAGRLVMQGFIDGLESQYDAVRDSLEGFTDDLSDNFAPDLAATVSADYSKSVGTSKSYGENVSGLVSTVGRGATVNIVNNYPQAQRDSKTRDDVADGIRLASSI